MRPSGKIVPGHEIQNPVCVGFFRIGLIFSEKLPFLLQVPNYIFYTEIFYFLNVNSLKTYVNFDTHTIKPDFRSIYGNV